MPVDAHQYGKRTRERTGGLMQKHREAKRIRFNDKLASGYSGPVILAEGDSWFEYPMADDLLIPLGDKYAIMSLAKAGDSFTEIAEQDELFPTLNDPPFEKEYHIVMLSLGGNEVMGHIEDFVRRNDPDRADEDYILPSFSEMLRGAQGVQGVRDQFDEIVGRIVREGRQHVILHGYDYPDPRFPPEPTEGPTGAQWIGPPLRNERLIGQLTTYREIVNMMLDDFNAMLAEIAARPRYEGRVHHVRLLGTIGKRDKNQPADPGLWVDEIHGSDDGFRLLAKKFEPVIEKAWASLQQA